MTENDAHPLAVNSKDPVPSNPTSAERDSTEGSKELNAIVADYEAKLDEVADLITRVRHEINNPLTGVLGQAQLLLREDLSEKARKRAETIEELAIRIRDIVAQLRQVQKPSRG
jgi:signal transduction histidine kinase